MNRFINAFAGCLFMVMAATGAAETTAPATLTVVSYNILHGTNQQGDNALTSQGLALLALQPGLVGLQEVDNQCARSGRVDQMKELERITGMHAAFGPHDDYQGGQYGLGLLSRFPLSDIQTDRITLFTKEGNTETRALLSATATLDDGTTVRLATVHMGLNQESRLVQAREIVGYLKPGEQTVLLTGDFNAEPGAPEMGILENAFQNLGDGLYTFPVGNPVKTIDYIMTSKDAGARVREWRVVTEVVHSDHYPVLAEVEFTAGE